MEVREMKAKWITMVLILLISTIAFAGPPNWQVISGTQYSMVVIAEILFDGVPFDDSGDNMAGAFGPGGVPDCRSIGVYQSVPTEFWYFTVVGNTNGETISFKIYDTLTDEVYDCLETVVFQDNITIGDPFNPFQLTAHTVQPGFIEGNVSLLTTSSMPPGNVQDVEVTAGDITVNPDASGDYLITITPGTYNVTASLSPGYTVITIEDVVVEENQTTSDIDFTLIDWTPISGTQYSMVVMATITLDGEFIDGSWSNQTGAFGPGSFDDCRAVAVWIPDVEIWYFTIVGNINGEIIGFKLYETETDTIYDCIETVIFADNATIGSPTDPFELTASTMIEQMFSLGANWNWISFNVHPEDTSLNSVFGSLGNNISQVKSQAQSATYYSGIWVGDLTNITDGEGYLVKMNNASDFSLLGMPIAYTTPINLGTNWNWIAYYPQSAVSIDIALNSIEDNASQIKNQTQSSTYYSGIWIGDLTVMEPGVGYKLMMNAPDVLIYEMGKCTVEKHTTANPNDWQLMTGTEYNMVVMANIEGVDPKSVMQVGVFDNDGNCRSIGKLEEGFWYFTVVGNHNDTELHFRTDNDLISNETITFENDATIGNPENPLNITFSNSTMNIPKVYELSQNYPNPFNPTTTIKYQLPEDTKVEIAVYNILGQKVRTLVNEKRTAGYYSVIWNGKDDSNNTVGSGIYFYKISTEKYSEIKKMLLMK